MAVVYLCLEMWSLPLHCSRIGKSSPPRTEWYLKEARSVGFGGSLWFSWKARVFLGQEGSLRGGAADYPQSYPDVVSVILFPYVGACLRGLTKVLANQRPTGFDKREARLCTYVLPCLWAEHWWVLGAGFLGASRKWWTEPGCCVWCLPALLGDF